MLNIYYYQSLNSSWSFMQDFVITPNDKINIVSGFMFEKKSLQRDYDMTSGEAVNINDFNFNTYAYPQPLVPYTNYTNRLFQNETGLYSQASYEYLPKNRLILGARYNKNSQFGDVFVIRSGLVSIFNNLVIKLLYGEGVQSPAPRILYGSWTFQGKNQDLKPIKASTTELNINYLTRNINATVSGYYILSNNTILQTSDGAENLGRKEVTGVDFFMKFKKERILGVRSMEIWTNYGFCLARGEEKPIAQTDGFEYDILGDIAPHKIYAGTNINFTNNIFLYIRGRYISEKNAIYSNPLKTIPSHYTIDANLGMKNIFNSGLGLSMNITNITDNKYFHSGIGSADAGIEPGVWENGVWKGSQGYYSSLLPQPHRLFIFSLSYELNNLKNR